MTNEEFEKRYGFPVDDVVGRYESENTLLRKINVDLLTALETVVEWAGDVNQTDIENLALTAINHAANDMRFGITEKKP